MRKALLPVSLTGLVFPHVYFWCRCKLSSPVQAAHLPERGPWVQDAQPALGAAYSASELRPHTHSRFPPQTPLTRQVPPAQHFQMSFRGAGTPCPLPELPALEQGLLSDSLFTYRNIYFYSISLQFAIELCWDTHHPKHTGIAKSKQSK